MNVTLAEMCNKYPELDVCLPDLEKAFALLKQTYRGGGKLLLCGNGGSASDSEHIVGELMKGFRSKRVLSEAAESAFLAQFPEDGDFLAAHLQGALPAISLVSHSALITAFANDVSAEMIFAQQVYGYGKPGDTLLGLSTSGNSANVKRAMQVAKVQGLHTIGLTGRHGGQMSELCDVTIRVPWDLTPDIQERHLPIYHALCIMLEEEFFPS
ncbi:D-sedoheptulose-7-phosphate isomerase [Paenibacillus agricola]|uniref:SIS domain-containing protein n=1 Tax=Paenibacillus agricola TaxID=2716264 RepID=A0ABX0JFQ8_9BACL|nr:SIS domain-containing protein [Paenibacillus agricola]NHN34225.1 SIS domain-containing protein [Paenibacillus agricola]